MRLPFIGIVCLLAAGMLPYSASILRSQPVLNGIGARAMTDRVEAKTQVDLHVTDRGEALVWWEASGTWLDMDGRGIDRPLPQPWTVRRMLGVQDSTWIGLLFIASKYFPTLFDLHLCVGNGDAIIDTSLVLGENGGTTYGDITYLADVLFSGISRHAGDILFIEHRRITGDNGGWPVGAIYHDFRRWRIGEDSVHTLLRHWPDVIRDSSGTRYRGLMHDYACVSAPRDTVAAIFLRRGGGRASEFFADSVYTEAVLFVDVRDGTVVDSFAVDTVSPDGLNRTPRILLLPDGNVDLIRNDVANTGLFADRYAKDGTHLGHFQLAERVVLETPDPAFRHGTVMEDEILTASKMDYDLVVLDDGSRLLAWSEATGGTGRDCHLRLYDRDWNPLGQVRRVHADTTGLQYHPVLAASGDLCMITWKSRRDLRDTLFVRSFLREQVLDAEDPPPVVDRLLVRGPWPHPARGAFTVEVEVPSSESHVTLECRHILGRLLFRREAGCSAGRVSFREDTQGLQPGLYFLQLRSGDDAVMRKLMVTVR